jgi:hypothetical protein
MEIGPIDKPEQELIEVPPRISARDFPSRAARISDTSRESSAEDDHDLRHGSVVEDKIVYRTSVRHIAVGGFENDSIR